MIYIYTTESELSRHCCDTTTDS